MLYSNNNEWYEWYQEKEWKEEYVRLNKLNSVDCWKTMDGWVKYNSHQCPIEDSGIDTSAILGGYKINHILYIFGINYSENLLWGSQKLALCLGPYFYWPLKTKYVLKSPIIFVFNRTYSNSIIATALWYIVQFGIKYLLFCFLNTIIEHGKNTKKSFPKNYLSR